MQQVFPEAIMQLAQPAIALPESVTVRLSKASSHVVYYLTASEDLEYPPHAHAAQFGVVLEGRIDITTESGTRTYQKGDRYTLQAGMRHGVKLYAGFAEISYLEDPEYFG